MRYLITLLAFLGTNCCLFAIKLAKGGSLEFEVRGKEPHFYPPRIRGIRRNKGFLLILVVVSSFYVGHCIIRASKNIVEQLRFEHEESLRFFRTGR